MNNFLLQVNRKDKIQSLQFILVALLIISFPYNISNSLIGTLSILLFATMLYSKSFNIKQFVKERVILVLFIFILFTYLSVLWSTVSTFDGQSDFHTSFDRFKYYLLLIPTLYFSHFSKEDIKKLFLFVALSSIPLIILYYLNAFGITHHYSPHDGGTSSYIRADLQENIFILFTAIYIYAHLIHAIHQRQMQKSLFLSVILLFTSLSMFIDPLTNTRIVNITFIFILGIGLTYIFKFKYFLLPSILGSIFLFVILLQDKSIVNGFVEFKEAISQNKYSGSWGHRVAYNLVGIDIFSKHPIIGNGINDISTKIIEHKKSNPEYFLGEESMTRLHNDHLLLLDQVGIVGYFIFLYFIYLLMKIKLSDKELNTFKNLFVISFMIIMLGEHYLTDKYSTNLFAIIVALTLLYKKLDHAQKTQHSNTLLQ